MTVSPMEFFGHLQWLDGRPLTSVICHYRAELFTNALYSFRPDGTPQYNLVLAGKAKKNWKTTDLVLAAFYRFIAWESPAGYDCFILANDEDQAADDLQLAKKLIEANPPLAALLTVRAKEIERNDGRGKLKILPARDIAGSHGKTYLFVGFDEIHGYKNWDLFEALSPDPSRLDALTWVTSYASILNSPGAPLHDLVAQGKAGTDPRMLFSWYSGDYGTDPDFTSLPTPEERANPSMESWGNPGYLPQQRTRLPTHKYRRLHLNLPGAPDGAFLDADKVQECIVLGRTNLPPQADTNYMGFVDMSGGSSDDAVLAIAHRDPGGRVVLDLVEKQAGQPPFNPRAAVRKFAGLLKQYGCYRVTGDAYAGLVFVNDFADHNIAYARCGVAKTVLYEAFEPVVNAANVELLDQPNLEAQLLTLVHRGGRIDHQVGDHDDWANAAAGAVWLVQRGATITFSPGALAELAGANAELEKIPGMAFDRRFGQ